MPYQEWVYSIIYALAALDGRERVLFGNCAPLAHEAFLNGLVGEAFPELWFEVPLAGDPWFDLHMLVEPKDVPDSLDERSIAGGYPEVFAWFANRQEGVRQLALSYDVSAGKIDSPAVQLLVNSHDPEVTCEFLAASGRADAIAAYRDFVKRIPQGWYPCYTGVFPRASQADAPLTGRESWVRIECIPTAGMQREYAENPALLEEHLRQAGLREFGDTLISHCQRLAQTPFQFECQFDLSNDGELRQVLGASVRFQPPSSNDERQSFRVDGAAGALMREVESWGLADNRWRLLADTAYTKRMKRGDIARTLYCYPAFIKIRWVHGEPLDAKAYLVAGTQ